MCGICATICISIIDHNNSHGLEKDFCALNNSSSETISHSSLEKLLERRGPDFSFEERFLLQPNIKGNTDVLHPNSSKIECILSASVLWTQGKSLIKQPLKSANKLFVFNGDIYSFGEKENPFMENDGQLLFSKLSACSCETEMFNILGSLKGPFAFIYLDIDSHKLYFARDFFGRSSLLFSKLNNQIIISSVSTMMTLHEIPAAGLYCLNFQTHEILLFPYRSHNRPAIQTAIADFRTFLNSANISLHVSVSDNTKSIIQLRYLHTKLSPMDETSPAFSKFLAHIQTPEFLASSSQQSILISILPLLEDPVQQCIQLLRASVKLRVQTQPLKCKNCVKTFASKCPHSTVSVLFSGGLDSTIIAFLAAEQLPAGSTLDLINVAFFKSSQVQDNDSIPDRKTGIASYKVLEKLFSPRNIKINLVLVNVLKEEVEFCRQDRIRNLILPLSSVLDDSLGCCLWFATLAKGLLYSSPKEEYFSPARIVLLGSGADELLGGYGRHRSAFESKGWEGLEAEMQMDLDRISLRNMGRDNRIVSDHGVAPRMPFLDEDFVSFVTQCELWMKCCPLLGDRGLGEKLLLRLCALKLLGEENVELSLFPKRAMQFGSKIAKLESNREKGNDTCDRLLLG